MRRPQSAARVRDDLVYVRYPEPTPACPDVRRFAEAVEGLRAVGGVQREFAPDCRARSRQAVGPRSVLFGGVSSLRRGVRLAFD